MHRARDSRRISRTGTTNGVTASCHTIFSSSFDRSSIRYYYFHCLYNIRARLANPVTSSSQNGRARKCLP